MMRGFGTAVAVAAGARVRGGLAAMPPEVGICSCEVVADATATWWRPAGEGPPQPRLNVTANATSESTARGFLAWRATRVHTRQIVCQPGAQRRRHART